MKNFFIKQKNKFITFLKSITLTRFLSYMGVLLVSFFLILYGLNIEYTPNNQYQELHNRPLDSIEYTKAKVLGVVDEWKVYKSDPETNETTDILYEVGYIYSCEILDGEYKGLYTYAIHVIGGETTEGAQDRGLETQMNNKITTGSNIYLRKIDSEVTLNSFLKNNSDFEERNDILYSFTSSPLTIDHWPTIIAIIAVFVILILMFSRVKGFHTLLSLALACASIFFVYIPAVLAGQNIYLWTIIICVYSIVETLILLEGITKKTLAASIGCVCGVLVSGILCVITNHTMNVIGSSEDIGDAQYKIAETFYYTFNQLKTLDLRGLIFSAVVFGSLGAIMDVAMSLASSLFEVYENSHDHSLANTMKSGFNIGRDMLGTMSNTLVLAYLSTSLCSTLYYVSHYYMEMLLRKEFIVLAISQAFIGCIGILITIPLTSLVCGLLYNKKEEWFPKKENSEITINE